MSGSTYNSRQIASINQIVGYLAKNGTLEPALLWDEPFTSVTPGGHDGVFPLEPHAARILSIVESISPSRARPVKLPVVRGTDRSSWSPVSRS